jgi:hypothetical protein
MDRSALVKAKLVGVVETARRVGEAGPSCFDCAHRTLGRCGNIAYVEQRFEPATGKHVLDYPVTKERARAEDGLCGPEALLFEPLPRHRALLKRATEAMDRHPFVSLGGLFGFWWAADLLLF